MALPGGPEPLQSSTLSDKRLFERKVMKLFSNAVSPCCQKVKMCLYELNLTFCETEVSLQSKENLSAWYTKLNPNGTIPALQVGDKVIGDSTKICLYLDENFGNNQLMPSDKAMFRKVASTLKLIDQKLHPASACLLWPMAIRPHLLEMEPDAALALIKSIPDQKRRDRQKNLFYEGLDAADVSNGVRVYRDIISKIDFLLRDMEWLSGDALGLADIALAPYLQLSHQFGWGDLFSDFEAVSRLFSKLEPRKSFKNGVIGSVTPEKRASFLIEGKASKCKILSMR